MVLFGHSGGHFTVVEGLGSEKANTRYRSRRRPVLRAEDPEVDRVSLVPTRDKLEGEMERVKVGSRGAGDTEYDWWVGDFVGVQVEY